MGDSTENNIIKNQEFKMFMFIAVFLFPILSIVLMGGFGFIIWISQLILGPPSY